MLSGKAADSLGDTVSTVQAKKISAKQTTEARKAATILQRIAATDRTAVEECINKHGALVWALAKQFTDWREEAETAAQEIFLDIWKHAVRFDSDVCDETDFIVLVARRWLIKQKLRAALDSATNSASSARV